MILVIDNYDSFTFNLVQVFGAAGCGPVVRRNDEITVTEIEAMHPDGIVLSPGPGRPAEAGCCVEVIRRCGPRVPLLGVCLGHQAIAEAFGARVERAPEVVHGKVAAVDHDGTGVFEGLESPLAAARYHSLGVAEASLPDSLRVTARTGAVVMGLRHVDYPIHGVQFHPESIAIPLGPQLLNNFVAMLRSHAEDER